MNEAAAAVGEGGGGGGERMNGNLHLLLRYVRRMGVDEMIYRMGTESLNWN